MRRGHRFLLGLGHGARAGLKRARVKYIPKGSDSEGIEGDMTLRGAVPVGCTAMVGNQGRDR